MKLYLPKFFYITKIVGFTEPWDLLKRNDKIVRFEIQFLGPFATTRQYLTNPMQIIR